MSTFILKILAVVFMLIDHIGAYIPGMPIWLRWIGRLAAPIFFFCSAWGFTYTRNRKKYILRLYIASVVMAVLNEIVTTFFPQGVGLDIRETNIFRTLFVMAVVLYFIEMKRGKDKNFSKYLSLFMIWQVVSIFITLYINSPISPYMWSALFGNIFLLEYGLIFVLLGVVMYLTKENKKHLTIGYLAVAGGYSLALAIDFVPRFIGKLFQLGLGVLYEPLEYFFWNFLGISPFRYGSDLLFENFQWMMLFSLPFMLAYNNKKGKSLKYFFYIFYPAHIFLLYFIAGAMN